MDSSNSGKYIHVKAIDNSNNVSAVSTLKLSGESTGSENDNTGGNTGDSGDIGNDDEPIILDGVAKVEGELDGVKFEKYAQWEDVENGIARIDLKDYGETTSEPMDVLLIMDTSMSMVFTSGMFASVCSPCMNPAHMVNGSHDSNITVGSSGCIDRLTVTKEVFNNFATSFMEKNSENRVAIVHFNTNGEQALDFSNNLTTITSTISNLQATTETFSSTNYDGGFDVAYSTIKNRNTNESGDANINSRKTVIIFFTDGKPTGMIGSDGGHSTCEATAATLKSMGTEIYTNALAMSASDQTTATSILKNISSDADHNFQMANTKADLENIYDGIANDIYFSGNNAVVTDIIDENWKYFSDEYYYAYPNEPTVNGQVVTWEQASIDSEYWYTFYIQLKDNDAEEYLDGTWDTNDGAKLAYEDINGVSQEISLSNPSLTRKAVTVNYYIQGSTTKIKKSDIIKHNMIGDVVEASPVEIYGYDVVSSNSVELEVTNGTNEINFEYIPKTGLSYTVNYYENGTTNSLLPTKTVNSQTFGSTVTENAADIDGYVKVEPSSKSIKIDLNNNIINFYYTKRTDLSYTVEYYFNGTKDNSLTEIVNNQTFNDEITSYPDKIKAGYKLEKVETLPLTITTGENLIKVFYVTDDSQTKELSYTVEYYKDGVLADTETEKTTVQYLEPNTMSVDKTKINTTNKYDGYYFVNTEPENIPNTVTTGTVIKVNYEIRKDLSYSIKYVDEETNEELKSSTTKTNQTYNSKVTENAPDIDGYTKVNPT